METPQTTQEETQVPTETAGTEETKATAIDFTPTPYSPEPSLGVIGPKDCRWPDEEKEKIVSQINISKPTSFDGETVQISIPVFAGDTAEDLDRRWAALTRPLQARMSAMNKAMMQVEQEQIARNRENEIAKIAHQAKVKQLAREKKKKH